jgi:hypothetical protein
VLRSTPPGLTPGMSDRNALGYPQVYHKTVRAASAAAKVARGGAADAQIIGPDGGSGAGPSAAEPRPSGAAGPTGGQPGGMASRGCIGTVGADGRPAMVRSAPLEAVTGPSFTFRVDVQCGTQMPAKQARGRVSSNAKQAGGRCRGRDPQTAQRPSCSAWSYPSSILLMEGVCCNSSRRNRTTLQRAFHGWRVGTYRLTSVPGR